MTVLHPMLIGGLTNPAADTQRRGLGFPPRAPSCEIHSPSGWRSAGLPTSLATTSRVFRYLLAVAASIGVAWSVPGTIVRGQEPSPGSWTQFLRAPRARPEPARANDPFAAYRPAHVPEVHAGPSDLPNPAVQRASATGPPTGFGLLPPAVTSSAAGLPPTGSTPAYGAAPYPALGAVPSPGEQQSNPAIGPPQPTVAPSVTPVEAFPLDQGIWNPLGDSAAAAPAMATEPAAAQHTAAPLDAVPPAVPPAQPASRVESVRPPEPVPSAVPGPASAAAPAAETEPGSPPRDSPDAMTRVLAVVGDQPILVGDLIGPINMMLSEYEGQAPEWEIAEQKKLLVMRQLPEVIKTKLVMIDVARTVPKERLTAIEDKVRKSFHEERLAQLQTALQAGSTSELDQKLRALGSSLSKQERTFFENVVAREWLNNSVEFDKDVAHDVLLAEYRSRQSEFHHPARVRWERLMVRFDAFATREEAMAAIAQLGNRVVRGESFATVARQGSHCPNAELDGQFDWTQRGSLASKTIEDVLFAIPVGQLSRVIEDHDGLHIVRVHEREGEGYTPFGQVQAQLAEAVRKRRFEAARDQYLDRLKQEIYVWIADDIHPPADSRLAGAPAAP